MNDNAVFESVFRLPLDGNGIERCPNGNAFEIRNEWIQLLGGEMAYKRNVSIPKF